MITKENGKYMDILEIVSELKRTYTERFGEVEVVSPDYGVNDNVIARMLGRLEDSDFDDVFKFLNIRQYGKYVLLRYKDMTELYSEMSPEKFWSMYGNLYRKCRTIVIDMSNCTCVMHGYDKFFNVGELEETSLKTVLTKVKECSYFEASNKLDGSMVIGRCIDGEIMLVTSNSIDPSESWRLELAYSLITDEIREMITSSPAVTFIFEMISPEDPHVVNYSSEEYGLHLIGIRCMDKSGALSGNGYLLSYGSVINVADLYGIKTTEKFDIDIDAIMSQLDDKKSDEAEGFVVRIDNDFYKIKYHDYVYMHSMLSGMVSPNAVINAIRKGTYDDFRSKIPAAYAERVTEIADVVFKCIKLLNIYVYGEVFSIRSMYSTIGEQMRYVTDNVEKRLQFYVRMGLRDKYEGLFSKPSTMRLNEISSLLYLLENTLFEDTNE